MNIEAIREIAKNRVTEEVSTEAGLERFLKRWWCLRYKRPFKDPLLQEYTSEELLLEFLEVQYWEDPKKLEKEENNGLTQEASEDEDWLKTQLGNGYIAPGDDIAEAAAEEAEDEKWIDKQISEALGSLPDSVEINFEE